MLNKEIIMANANVYQKTILKRMFLKIIILALNHVTPSSDSVD